MSGVNDLANQWRKMLNRTDAGYYSMTVCAGELEELARTAWHPVSEPPTEADGDEAGHVAVWFCDDGVLTLLNYRAASVSGPNAIWARIRDVILMPGGE